jgi:hypothetical protein
MATIRPRFTVTFQFDTHDEVIRLANKFGISKSELVSDLCDRYLIEFADSYQVNSQDIPSKRSKTASKAVLVKRGSKKETQLDLLTRGNSKRFRAG